MMLQTQNPDELYYASFDSVVENVGEFKAQIITTLKKAVPLATMCRVTNDLDTQCWG